MSRAQSPVRRRTKEFHLDDCSAFRHAGTQDSFEIQRQLLSGFVRALKKHAPEDATICEGRSMNKAWLVLVHFPAAAGSVDTDTYRGKIKREFSLASVKSAKDGDEWTLPYETGIQSGQSALLTLLIVVFCTVVPFGLAWAAFA